MKAYNGFPGEYRAAQYRVLKAAWAAGTVPRPERCEVCGQTDGQLNAHSEDYTDILNAHHLCVVCHLAIHCRWSMPALWETYRDMVARGWRPPPSTQQQVMRNLRTLNALPADQWPGAWTRDTGDRVPTLLDTLPTDRGYVHPNAEQFADRSREHEALFDM